MNFFIQGAAAMESYWMSLSTTFSACTAELTLSLPRMSSGSIESLLGVVYQISLTGKPNDGMKSS